MTATIFTIVSGKGGTGTSTAAINIGAALAGFAKKTLIIDTDIGMPTIGLMLGLEASKATIHEVLAGKAELKEALYDGPNNMHILPGSISLQGFVNANLDIIGDILESVKEKYDWKEKDNVCSRCGYCDYNRDSPVVGIKGESW